LPRLRPGAELEHCLPIDLAAGPRVDMSDGATVDGARRKDLIEIRDLCMRFRTQSVLRGINLTIHRGETVCIIGESGCGKTVMLKLIIGLMRPTVGRVLFDGKVLVDLPERELTRQRLRFGFLFQGAALFDSLSVYDNVAFGPRAQGRPESEIKEV